jgi:hypothetical protein
MACSRTTRTTTATGIFDDAASSALLAATVYRLDLLTGNKTFIQEAELTRVALFATDGTSRRPNRPPCTSHAHDTIMALGEPDTLFSRLPESVHKYATVYSRRLAGASRQPS